MLQNYKLPCRSQLGLVLALPKIGLTMTASNGKKTTISTIKVAFTGYVRNPLMEQSSIVCTVKIDISIRGSMEAPTDMISQCQEMLHILLNYILHKYLTNLLVNVFSTYLSMEEWHSRILTSTKKQDI
jgi:hypothetical protein